MDLIGIDKIRVFKEICVTSANFRERFFPARLERAKEELCGGFVERFFGRAGRPEA